MLNDNWMDLPQSIFACAQLFAGAIIIKKNKEAVILNTVEIYNRQRSLDVHRETIINKKGVSRASSLPPVNSKYPNTWATVLVDTEGKKLITGSKTMNALVTPSLRVDSVHEASVGGLVSEFFIEDNEALSTSVFLDNESIKKANIIALDFEARKIDRFDLQYQLRQLRTKFHSKSTYPLCRASSVSGNDMRSQPYTIFTLCEVPDTGRDSATKTASRLFDKIAHLARTSNEPVLPKEYVNNLMKKLPQDGQVKDLFKQILDLYSEDESEKKIINDTFLNEALSSLVSLHNVIKYSFCQSICGAKCQVSCSERSIEISHVIGYLSYFLFGTFHC